MLCRNLILIRIVFVFNKKIILFILGVYPNCICKDGKIYDHLNSVSYRNRFLKYWQDFFSNTNCNFRFASKLIAQNVQNEVAELFQTANVKKDINLMTSTGIADHGIWTILVTTVLQQSRIAHLSIFGQYQLVNVNQFVVQMIERFCIQTARISFIRHMHHCVHQA